MKNKLGLLIIVLITISAYSQEVVNDTLQIQQLNEVYVEAPKVIRKADMDVYYPSKSAVANSQNGFQLLNNLMIPTLSVSDALGTIKAAGQSVQLRINGRVSSIDQVRSLLPETIKRVEWIENPGLIYNGANYVLNFIVTNPSLGGSLMVMARPALNQAWGFYNGNVKFNNGKSQWEIGGNFKLTNKIKSHREYTETFTYPDGNSLTRDETPRGGIMDNSMANGWISYNYVKPDTTIFMAELLFHQNIMEKYRYDGLLSLSNGESDILLTDQHGNTGSTPSLSLYWQQHLPRKQIIVVDFNSSLYFGKSFSDYLESLPNSYDYITDINTNIKDRNQAYGIEANYIKNWNKSKLTAGISYIANRNRSQYVNLDNQIFHQRQDKIYFFAEYFQRLGKWTVTAGMGVQYTDFLFKETNEGNHSWSPRPQATITYSLNQNHNFRLSFTSWQSAPSLSQTNIVPQQIDGFQWIIGNQDLKTSNSYMLTFRYGFNLPRVTGSFGIRAFNSPNAITPILLWEGEKLITTYENSNGLKNLSFFLAPQIEIIPKWILLSGYIQYRMEKMRGTGYSLHNNAWSGNAQIQIMHWGFVLSGQYVRAQRDLWGEKISWGENLNIIGLTYNWKSWQFTAGIIMPFGKYDQGSELLSKWNRNEQHLRLDMRMPYISISYNLQWGRQKRGVNKLIDNEASVDKSTTGGR